MSGERKGLSILRDNQIIYRMFTIIALAVITIGIIISVYLANTGKRDASRISIICAVIAAVLTFLGPYIVNFAERMDEKYSIKEVITDSGSTPSGIIEETNDEEPGDSISDNDTDDINDTPDDDGPGPETDMAFIIFVGEAHEPSDDDANQVEVSNWIKNEDYDLLGRTYDGGVKISISNTSYAFGPNSNISMEIVSEAHYALDAAKMEKISEENLRLEGKFVVEKDTNASPSTAVISILVDGEEVYNSGTINCYSANIEPFDIMLAGKKELVIRTVCQYRGEPFLVGLVDK